MTFHIVWKTALLYIIVVISMRLMGKRQIGELQPFEFAVAIIISETAVFPLTEENKSVLDAIIPIGILVVCQFLL